MWKIKKKKITGKYVQYSEDTAWANPDMIVREYERLIAKHSKEVEMLSHTTVLDTYGVYKAQANMPSYTLTTAYSFKLKGKTKIPLNVVLKFLESMVDVADKAQQLDKMKKELESFIRRYKEYPSMETTY